MSKLKIILISLLSLLFSSYLHATPDSLKVLMLSPKYRNAIYASMQSPDKVTIKSQVIVADYSQLTLDVSLSRNNTNIKNWSFSSIQKDMKFDLPVKDVTFQDTRSGPYVKDDNPYLFTFVLKNNNALVASKQLKLNKYPSPPSGVNEVRLDDQGNFLINGKRKFFFGSYLAQYNPDFYNFLENVGVDLFMEYSFRFNLHSDASWGIIRTDRGGKLNVVRARQEIVLSREMPKLIGYRLLDEPNSHGPSVTVARQHYQAAMEEDPYHPAMVVWTLMHHLRYQVSAAEYTGVADLIGIDSYPIYTDTAVNSIRGLYRNIGVVSLNYQYFNDSTKRSSFYPNTAMTAWEQEELPTIGVVQMFNAAHWAMPNVNQIKNMAFQHIAGGAKSLIPYSYDSNFPDQFAYYGETLKPEIESIMDAVVVDEAPNNVKIISSDDQHLTWSYRKNGKKEYLILVNTSSDWNDLLEDKNKQIRVEIEFLNRGKDKVKAVVRDSNVKKKYKLTKNKFVIQLEGVNNNSSGVIVFKRKLKKSKKK